MAKSPANRAKARRSTQPKSPGGKDLAKRYEPTPRERAAVEAYLARREETLPAPRVTFTKTPEGVAKTELDHPEPMIGQVALMEALGTRDGDFLGGLLDQLVNAGTKGQEPDEAGVNFMLSVVKGVEPRDQVETMLAAQMAAIHMATMTFARRLANVDNIPQQDSAERAFNRLARTFAAQMEALKRYRSRAEQKIVVEHVTVNEGGQAIVGNVTQGGRGPSENKGASS